MPLPETLEGKLRAYARGRRVIRLEDIPPPIIEFVEGDLDEVIEGFNRVGWIFSVFDEVWRQSDYGRLEARRQYNRANYIRARVNRKAWDGINQVLAGITGGLVNYKLEYLDCTPREYVRYIEAQFEGSGMTWYNHGRAKGWWHIDHKRPVVRFDMFDLKEVALAFHYTNTRPRWSHENKLRKSDLL